MRIDTVFSSLLAFGMLSLTVACEPQKEQEGPSGGTQPAASSAIVPDSTGGWIGKTATGFSLPDTEGKTVDVGKVLGAKPVILVFYRGVW